MPQPMQRKVDARGREQCQRTRRAFGRLIGPVDDPVIERREVGHVEDVADLPEALGAQVTLEMDAFGNAKCTGIGWSEQPTSIATWWLRASKRNCCL